MEKILILIKFYYICTLVIYTCFILVISRLQTAGNLGLGKLEDNPKFRSKPYKTNINWFIIKDLPKKIFGAPRDPNEKEFHCAFQWTFLFPFPWISYPEILAGFDEDFFYIVKFFVI